MRRDDPGYVRDMLVTARKALRRVERKGREEYDANEGVRLGEMVVRIGGQDVALPCAFSPVESTPALLGRAGVFDRFRVLLDARVDMIAFEPAGA